MLSSLLGRAAREMVNTVPLWYERYHKLLQGFYRGHGTAFLMHERELRELGNREGWVTCHTICAISQQCMGAQVFAEITRCTWAFLIQHPRVWCAVLPCADIFLHVKKHSS